MYYHFRTPFLDLKNYNLNCDIVNRIPEDFARKHKIIALDSLDNLMTIGICSREDVNLIPLFEQELGCKIIPFLINSNDWEEKISTAYINQEQPNWIG